MPVTLATNCFYTLSLGDQRLRRLLSEPREQATYMGVLDQIKDWFYSGQKKSCLDLMFTLLREIDTPDKLAEFKLHHGESLKKLFQDVDHSDLIKFWNAHDEQGHSLIGNAMLSGHTEIIEPCLSLLDFFPLNQFTSWQVTQLIECANTGPERHTLLGLAILNNRPDMLTEFLALYKAVTDRCRAEGGELVLNDNYTINYFVFGKDILRELRSALRSATTSAQLNGLCLGLDIIRHALPNRGLQTTYHAVLLDMARNGEFGALKSALRNGDNAALINCFVALLTIASPRFREYFLRHYLKADFSLVLDELTKSETELPGDFEAIDRYVSLYRRLQIKIQPELFCLGNRSASFNIAAWLRLAFRHRQETFSSWLLNSLSEVELDSSFLPFLSSLTAELFDGSDWNSLEILLKSVPLDFLLTVLEPLLSARAGHSKDSNPKYEKISEYMIFAGGRIVVSKIVEGNQGKLTVNERQLELLVQGVDAIVKAEQASITAQTSKFMLENNGFFVQLMAYCTNHENAAIRQAAARLYDQYLKLDELIPHAAFLARYCGLADGIRSSSSEEEVGLETDDTTLAARAEKNPVQKTDRVYIFVCPKPGQDPDGRLWTGVLLNQENIADMLGQQEGEWPVDTFTEVVDIEGRREVAEKLLGDNVAKTYLQFPVFAKRYTEMESTRLLKKLFQIIDLKYIASAQGEVSTDYTSHFLAALAVNKMRSPKFTATEDQERLKKIFGKYLIMPVTDPTTLAQVPTIRSDHLKKIYALYGLVTDPGTAQDKIAAAQTLFCLATLFCRFSSKSMFGKESDSPGAIRYYAGALLKQAFELAPSVVQKSSYLGLMDALYGLKEDVQTCTDVLSRSMVDYIRAQKSPQFDARFFRIKPAAWQMT